jgi:hypothetical protein
MSSAAAARAALRMNALVDMWRAAAALRTSAISSLE